MVRAVLVSYAMRQLFVLGREVFAKRHANCWLVWEPGAWIVAKSAQVGTVASEKAPSPRPGQGDALCFEMVPSPTGGDVIRVGRAENSEIVVNDATVSREHLRLMLEKGGWSATVCSGHGVKFLGTIQPTGTRFPLRQGNQIELGDVRLTFHDANGFMARLDGALAPAK